ncbi:hypothetical protein LBMAG42_21840 [Deltaproteobacteria bacterium]|nr:hypothetical protein LBMAG42_21840 [Deltaproteobacteria bacterium]
MSALLLLALACADSAVPEATSAPLSGAAGGTFFQVEIPDYYAGDDGKLVAQLIEDVPGAPGSVVSATMQVSVTDEGYVSLELPTPTDESIDSVRYRFALREALADGTAGAFRGIWTPRLTWHATSDAAGAPPGWSTERSTRSGLSWTPVADTELKLSLLPVESLVAGGPFDVPDVVTDAGSNVRVALLDGDEVVEGAVGMVLDGTWAIMLDGAPDTERSQLRPVAFIDANGDLAYDPASEARIGLACAESSEAFVKWIDEPYTVVAADSVKRHGASVGWNSWMAGGRVGGPTHGTVVRISPTCD